VTAKWIPKEKKPISINMKTTKVDHTRNIINKWNKQKWAKYKTLGNTIFNAPDRRIITIRPHTLRPVRQIWAESSHQNTSENPSFYTPYSRVIKKKLYLIFVQHCSFFEAFMHLNHRKFFFLICSRLSLLFLNFLIQNLAHAENSAPKSSKGLSKHRFSDIETVNIKKKTFI
jgi:hypothetical protein